MAATITRPPQPRPEDTPEYAEDVFRVAEALHDEGIITPAHLRPHPEMAEFIAPLEALIAARGTP